MQDRTEAACPDHALVLLEYFSAPRSEKQDAARLLLSEALVDLRAINEMTGG